MDCRANSDLFLLTDEKFDFDVSLSPASSRGDDEEDEVFTVPLGCGGSWSPLTGDQLDAVRQEAHRLAEQLRGHESNEPHGESATTSSVNSNDSSTDGEQFVQGAEDKLGVLGRPPAGRSPVKRQTFCVEDSPMRDLPPAIQRRLLRGSSAAPPSQPASSTRLSARVSSARRVSATAAAASSTRLSATTASPARLAGSAALSARLSAKLGTSSPAGGARARASLRGRAALGVTGVLPSKPAAVAASCSSSRRVRERSTLQPPSQVVGGRRSPSSRPSSRAQSSEDLLSDSTSVTSDVSDSSLNSSLVGKRTLAPPTKRVARNTPGVQAPPLQSRRGADRKNTSSSSSSVSSFNSSLSQSPAKGKLNSSLNQGGSAPSPAPSSISRPVGQSRLLRSKIAYTPSEPPLSSSTAAPARRSLSAQTARKLSEADRVKVARLTPLKATEATPLQPSKRPVEPMATARLQSAGKAKVKPLALVPPTPSGGGRGVRSVSGVSSPDVLKELKRLQSVGSVDSDPQKLSAGPLTPSAGSGRALPIKVRRPSALPTPLKRRPSAIPAATPTRAASLSKPAAASAPPTSDAPPAASGADTRSPSPSGAQEEEPADAPDVQPFVLEEDVPPPPPPSDQSHTGELSPNQSEPGKDLIELECPEESNSKTQEVLLLDLPAPTLQPQEKLLIELTNTPDLIRTSGKNGTTAQLIDLSSPLIRWSPDEKKSAPLINLSF